MARQARVLKVLIASPGDTIEARDVVERTITNWNRDRWWRERTLLSPVRWETDAVPAMAADGQSVINRQLVDDADIVIALFHSTLGTPTARAVSGTAEEIELGVRRDIPVHIFLAEMPHPHDVDLGELRRLRDYVLTIQKRGLLGRYASYADLEERVRAALQRDVDDLTAESVPERAHDIRPVPDSQRRTLRAKSQAAREPLHGGHGSLGGTQPQRLARNLRAYRKNLGLTQEALAHRAGMHRVYLGRLERGDLNPSLLTIERFAQGIGVEVSDLLR